MREMIWVARFADGRVVREWQLKDGRWVETPWNTLRWDGILRVDLEGSGMRLGVIREAGTLHLGGELITLVLRSGDHILSLTGRPLEKFGLEQYKTAYTTVSGGWETNGRHGPGGGKTVIERYTLGFVRYGHDPLIGEYAMGLHGHVPTSQDPPYFTLRLECERSFQGTLTAGFKRLTDVPTTLEANKAYELRLDVEVESYAHAI